MKLIREWGLPALASLSVAGFFYLVYYLTLPVKLPEQVIVVPVEPQQTTTVRDDPTLRQLDAMVEDLEAIHGMLRESNEIGRENDALLDELERKVDLLERR